MKNICYYREFIINEALGVNKDVMNFSKQLCTLIIGDINKSLNYNYYQIPNYLNISKINFYYQNLNTHNVASITYDKNLNELIININLNNITNFADLQETINHELLHAHSQVKGYYTISKEYQKISQMNDKFGANFGYVGKFVYILYLMNETEINSYIHELYIHVKNQNITTKSEYNKWIVKNELYLNYKYVLTNFDIYFIWNEIKKEGFDNYLIKELNIKNINSWLIKKEKNLIKMATEAKKRLLKMGELFDRNF